MNPDTSRGNKSVDTMIEDGSLAGRHGCPFKRFPHWREKPLQPPYRSRGCHRAGLATYITPILHIVHNDTSVSIYIYIYIEKKGGHADFRGFERPALHLYRVYTALMSATV